MKRTFAFAFAVVLAAALAGCGQMTAEPVRSMPAQSPAGTAAPVSTPVSDPDGFSIYDYDVLIAISDDNVYDVEETIAVVFSEPRHGIYRDIPLDGAEVSDIGVHGYEFAAGETDGYMRIKIGSADATVEGLQTYRLSYRLHLLGDGGLDFDEVYYNIVDAGWNAQIDRVSFSVTLPKPFNAEKLGFSMGPAGTEGYEPAEFRYSVEGNTVSGKTLRALAPYEGLTMRVELPQDYFR